MEQHDLTTPKPATGGTGFWKPRHLVLHYDDGDPGASYVKVQLAGANGERSSAMWTGTTAHDLIKQLNTANLSAGQSLHRRLLQRLAADGLIGPGSVSGAPDA